MAKISLAKPAPEPVNTVAYVPPVEETVAPVIPTTEATPPAPPTPAADVIQTNIAPEPESKPETTNVTKITFGENLDEVIPPALQQNAEPAKPKLEDILKEIPKEELYKHLGLDEQTIKFDEYRKKGGNPYDYIKQKAVDYTKLPDEILLKDKLKEQYPNIDEEELQVLFDDRYGQDEMEEEKVNKKKAILAKADAYEQRQKRIQQQQSNEFTTLTPPASTEPNQYEEIVKQSQQNTKAAIDYITNDEPVQNFLKEKKLKIDLGNGKFHTFEIDNAKHLLDIIVDSKVSGKYGNNAQGKPDTQLLLQLALFKAYPQQFISGILEEGRSLALLDELLKDGQNATPPSGAAPKSVSTGNKKITPTTGRIVPYSG